MAIIFSEEDLKDVKPPCVIQSFINHNAVLYKVFVVGDSYTVVERPSLKNFPAGQAGKETDGWSERDGDDWGSPKAASCRIIQTVEVARLPEISQ